LSKKATVVSNLIGVKHGGERQEMGETLRRKNSTEKVGQERGDLFGPRTTEILQKVQYYLCL